MVRVHRSLWATPEASHFSTLPQPSPSALATQITTRTHHLLKAVLFGYNLQLDQGTSPARLLTILSRMFLAMYPASMKSLYYYHFGIKVNTYLFRIEKMYSL